MKKIETELKDCYILEPDKFGDERGYYSPFFVEEKNKEEEINMKSIAQGARSFSSKGILRGLHYQEDPLCQAKLVECLSGAVLDVVVDLRKDSPTYKKWTSVYLTPENGRQLFVPRGFAHGFVSLKDNTLFQYLVDNDYKPSHENGIAWNDPELNIDWQLKEYGIENPILSEKDKVRPILSEMNPNFYQHKRYLVTGYNGQLGFDIVKELNNQGIYDILALDINDMDITDARIVNKIFEEYQPEYVLHCAAYTNVDQAEDVKDLCYKINVTGTKNIVEASRRINAKLTYISTDYVFDGKKEGLYETSDEINPLSVYGKTKYLGEQEVRKYDNHFIVRISWVFGINGKNFVKTMLNLAETKDELNIVSDQIGSPTYTVDLAKLLVKMQNTEKYGTYHATNDGFCNWAEFAEYIFKSNNKNVKVNYIPASSYPTKAIRPNNSKLSKQSLLDNDFDLLPDWHDAVDRYNKELEKVKIKKI
ncbi:MAG: dTDP-4-dehydrorhamnose reductase [Bacilli bacterium]|nr:dTDP-4-dehydrorhamnose reductase [Bacilli bacterium]